MKEPYLPYYLPIARRNRWIHAFSKGNRAKVNDKQPPSGSLSKRISIVWIDLAANLIRTLTTREKQNYFCYRGNTLVLYLLKVVCKRPLVWYSGQKWNLPRLRCWRRCPWCSRYRRRKWIRRYEFKSWTRLIAFHIALIPLGKVWIQLFSLQLWVNSRTD